MSYAVRGTSHSLASLQRTWTSQEDATLKKEAGKWAKREGQGIKGCDKWQVIAPKLPHRTAKMCRARYDRLLDGVRAPIAKDCQSFDTARAFFKLWQHRQRLQAGTKGGKGAWSAAEDKRLR